jgi:transcriptional regulator with XRE-family HTH domain
MNINQTISALRKQLGFTQKDVSEGILSQSSYSRFERNEQSLSLEELEKILDRMGIQMNDINDLKQASNIHVAYIRKQIYSAFQGNLSNKEVVSLYFYSEEHKKESLMLLRYYYYIRQHFHTHSEQIPALTSKDLNEIFTVISRSKSLTSVYLQFIIDFTVHFTTPQLLHIINMYQNTEIPWGTAMDSTTNRLLPNLLSNIIDNLIDRAIVAKNEQDKQLLELVPALLDQLKKALDILYSFNFSLLYKYSKLRYQFYVAATVQERTNAETEIKTFIDHLTQIIQITEIRNPYAESCKAGMINLLESGIPKTSPWYIIN